MEPKGRGFVLNSGFDAAPSTEFVLFCHADTIVPEGYDVALENALRDEDVLMTAFSFGLDEQAVGSWPLQIVQRSANLRSTFWWMPYGDQALGFRTREFETLGKFRSDFKIMEDFDLVRRVRHKALISRNSRLEILPDRIETSSRRWQERGVIKTTGMNWFFCAAYVFLGMSPDAIFKWYYGQN